MECCRGISDWLRVIQSSNNELRSSEIFEKSSYANRGSAKLRPMSHKAGVNLLSGIDATVLIINCIS